MKKKSLSVNAFLNGIRQLLNVIFPLITFPYTTRILSVNSMGIYNFSNTYVNYFLLLATLGIPTYAVREGAKYRDNSQKISDFASQIFTLNILATLFSYLLLFLSLTIFDNLKKYLTCILVFSLQIIFTTIGTEWIYTIYEDFAYITVRSIIFKIISIILLFIIVKHPNDYIKYAGITVFASVGSNILNYIHAKSFIKIRLTNDFLSIKKHLKPTFIIFFSNIAVNIYVASDTTILGLMKGDHAVGIYGVSSKIYSVMAPLLASILIVTVPRLALLFGKKKLKEYEKTLGFVIKALTIILLPSATGLIIVAPEVILIISGSKYLEAILSLRLLSIALIFSLLNTILSDCVLIPLKKENKLLITNITAAIFNLVLNLILIPIFSFNAASFTTIISELLSMLLNFSHVKSLMLHVLKKERIIQNLVQVMCGCLIIILCCFLINALQLSPFISLILKTTLSTILYSLFLWIMQNEVFIDFIQNIVVHVTKK